MVLTAVSAFVFNCWPYVRKHPAETKKWEFYVLDNKCSPKKMNLWFLWFQQHNKLMTPWLLNCRYAIQTHQCFTPNVCLQLKPYVLQTLKFFWLAEENILGNHLSWLMLLRPTAWSSKVRDLLKKDLCEEDLCITWPGKLHVYIYKAWSTLSSRGDSYFSIMHTVNMSEQFEIHENWILQSFLLSDWICLYDKWSLMLMGHYMSWRKLTRWT